MLEIKPIQEKKEQERVCALCGITYDVDMLAYAAYNDNILVGTTQFVVKEKYGYIYDIRNVKTSNDVEALFIMGRATLNFIDLCDVHEVYFEKDTPEYDKIAVMIGFKRNEHNKWFIDLKGFFNSPCTK